MRDQKTDLIRYRYNIVAEDGRTVIRAVPVKACRVEVQPEPVSSDRKLIEPENDGNSASSPVLRRLRHRLLDR